MAVNPNLMPWKKGQSGNPKGREALPKYMRDAINLNRAEFRGLLNIFLRMSQGDMEARLSHPKTPMLEKIVGQIIEKAATDGDHVRLNFLVEQLMGKLPQNIEVHSYAQMSTPELLHLAKQKILEIEGEGSGTIDISADEDRAGRQVHLGDDGMERQDGDRETAASVQLHDESRAPVVFKE